MSNLNFGSSNTFGDYVGLILYNGTFAAFVVCGANLLYRGGITSEWTCDSEIVITILRVLTSIMGMALSVLGIHMLLDIHGPNWIRDPMSIIGLYATLILVPFFVIALLTTALALM